MRRTILFFLLLLILAAPGGVVSAQGIRAGDVPVGLPAGVDTSLPGIVQVPGGAQVSAQSGGGGLNLFPIVPCGTRQTGQCTPCGFLDILENLVKFVTFGVTGPVAAVIFIYAGFKFMFARGNPSSVTDAKRVLTNAVYGVAIILLAWVIVVQLIKTIAPGGGADRWYEFNCPEFLQVAGGEPVPVPVSDLAEVVRLSEEDFQQQCLDPAVVSARNGNSKGQVNSAELSALIACLTDDPIVKLIEDAENRFSFENINTNNPLEELCGVRRGNPVSERSICGVAPCAHGALGGGMSCHYGGRTGVNGAEAVDFNIKEKNPGWVCPEQDQEKDNDGQLTGRCLCPKDNWCGTRPDGTRYQIAPGNDRALEVELKRVAKKNNCAVKRLAYESPPHVHVSTLACDMDFRSAL